MKSYKNLPGIVTMRAGDEYYVLYEGAQIATVRKSVSGLTAWTDTFTNPQQIGGVYKTLPAAVKAVVAADPYIRI